MSIYFFTEDIQYRLRHKRLLRYWLQSTSKMHGFGIDALNIIICSDPYLLNINRLYLNHDYLTDVITFPYQEETGEIQGDVFISLDRVRDNAKERNISVTRELHRVMVHGLLHLIGFDDRNPKAKTHMTQLEDQHLSELDTLVSRGTIS